MIFKVLYLFFVFVGVAEAKDCRSLLAVFTEPAKKEALESLSAIELNDLSLRGRFKALDHRMGSGTIGVLTKTTDVEGENEVSYLILVKNGLISGRVIKWAIRISNDYSPESAAVSNWNFGSFELELWPKVADPLMLSMNHSYQNWFMAFINAKTGERVDY